MLLNPSIAANRQLASSVEAAAGPLGIAVTTAAVTDSGSLEQALAAFRPDFIGLSLRNIADVVFKRKETYFGALIE